MKKYMKRYLIFVFIAILLFTQGIFAEDLSKEEELEPRGEVSLSITTVEVNTLTPIQETLPNETFAYHVIITNTGTTTISSMDYMVDQQVPNIMLPVNELAAGSMVDLVLPVTTGNIGIHNIEITVTGIFNEISETDVYMVTQLGSMNVVEQLGESDNGVDTDQDDDIPEDNTDDSDADTPEDNTDGSNADTPEDSTDGSQGDTPEDSTDGSQGDTPEDSTDGSQGDTPEDSTDGSQGNNPDDEADADNPIVLLEYEMDLEVIALPDETSTTKRCRWFLDEVVTYKYIITNTGSETINGFRFIDVDINENVDKNNSDDWTIFDIELASSESTVFYRTYTTKALGDFNNYSYVQGFIKTTDNGVETIQDVGEEDWNWECIEVYEPAIIELTKVAVVSQDDNTLVTEVKKGDTVTYKFTICNKGPHDFGEVKLYDDMLDLDDLGERFGELKSGEIKDVYYTYITDTEGELTNNARVEGYLGYYPETADEAEHWCRMVEDQATYTVTVDVESPDPGSDPGTDSGNGTNPGSNPTPTPTPKPNPTSTPKPNPDPVIPTPTPANVPDEPTPQQPVETVPTEKDLPTDNPEEFTDLDIPEDVPEDLPKSGGTSSNIFFLFGGLSISLGFVFKRR